MKRMLICMPAMLMILVSCSSSSRQKNTEKSADITLSEVKYAPPKIVSNEQERREEKGGGATDSSASAMIQVKQAALATTHEDWDKKIIKTAEVTLELKDYDHYNLSLHKGLKSYGAYIATEEQDFSDDRKRNELIIKVPVEQFDNLVNSFAGEGIKVLQKKINSEDVTGEVVDTKARMEAKKRMRDRYLELLKQAKNMKEVLDVQREINSIQEEIESASGRVGYLNHASAYSTVQLHYCQLLTGTTSHSGETFLIKLVNSFKNGFVIIGELVLLAVNYWPLIIIAIFVFTWWYKRKVRKLGI